MSSIRFDVSHLYDFITERRGKYVICFDMYHLMYINDTYGMAAGDVAISECLRRIDSNSDDDSLLIRIGGDEFILITDCSEKAEAEKQAERILALNGGIVKSGSNEFEVSMRAGLKRYPKAEIYATTSFLTALSLQEGLPKSDHIMLCQSVSLRHRLIFFENCVQNIRKSIAISVQMVYNNIKCCFCIQMKGGCLK